MTSGLGHSQAALPRLVVFDLDDCCWTPEMHELSGMPSVEVEGPLDPKDNDSTLGVVGMKVPSGRRGGWGNYGSDEEEVVELFDGARQVFRELALNPIYKGVRIAVASTSLEPSYSRACIKGLEVRVFAVRVCQLFCSDDTHIRNDSDNRRCENARHDLFLSDWPKRPTDVKED